MDSCMEQCVPLWAVINPNPLAFSKSLPPRHILVCKSFSNYLEQCSSYEICGIALIADIDADRRFETLYKQSIPIPHGQEPSITFNQDS